MLSTKRDKVGLEVTGRGRKQEASSLPLNGFPSSSHLPGIEWMTRPVILSPTPTPMGVVPTSRSFPQGVQTLLHARQMSMGQSLDWVGQQDGRGTGSVLLQGP